MTCPSVDYGISHIISRQSHGVIELHVTTLPTSYSYRAMGKEYALKWLAIAIVAPQLLEPFLVAKEYWRGTPPNKLNLPKVTIHLF